MKKYFLFVAIAILILNTISFAQFDISASMGIDFVNSPSFSDYITQNYVAPGETVSGFNAAVIFSGEVGYMVSETYEAAIDVGYLINSYTSSLANGQYDINYGNLMFSVLNFYVLHGDGYSFKFGGGAGLRFLNAGEKPPGATTTTTYSSTGFGVLLRIEGNTLLGGNIYAKIAAQAGYDINGEPLSNGLSLTNPAINSAVNFNSLSVGLSLGVSYIF
jgi:hypothetical protein